MLHQGILPLLPTAKDNLGVFTSVEINSLTGEGLQGLLTAPDGSDLGLTVTPEGSNYTIQFTRATGTDLLGRFILYNNYYTFNVQYAPYSYVTLKTDYNNTSNRWEKVLRALEYIPDDLEIYGANPYDNYCYNIVSPSLNLPLSPYRDNTVYEFNLRLDKIWLSQEYITLYTGATTNGLLTANVRGKVTLRDCGTVTKEELTLAGQPVISNEVDENGKYITINVPNSPTDTPTGNIYRNGGSEPVGKYVSTGNKTAKWYITDSPIGENGDAYTANQVYNDGISTLYSLISNTTLVEWTYIKWNLTETPNHEIGVECKDKGSFSNIKIYKNEEDTPVIDTTPNGDYEELFSVDAYGPATYKVVGTPRAGYKFDSDYTNTLHIALDKQTIEVQTEFNEINGELSAVENQYLGQMNITPDIGWTRKDFRTVIINDSGTYTITLESNDPLWVTLIPVPATYNITAALDTPILNVDCSNRLEAELVWDETDSTTYYEIYQDGKLIDSVPSESNNMLMARSIENKEKKRWIKNV